MERLLRDTGGWVAAAAAVAVVAAEGVAAFLSLRNSLLRWPLFVRSFVQLGLAPKVVYNLNKKKVHSIR